jgi:hypothetical protein
MSRPRIVELCLDTVDHAVEAVDQLVELEEANRHGGAGTHRDPSNIFLDLREELIDLRDAAREARDEAERLERGLR